MSDVLNKSMTIKQTVSKGRIIPAILASGNDFFVKELEFAKKVGAVHLDVCDGDFVKSLTLPIDKWPDKINVDYSEVHLMVRRPEEYLDELAKHGICRAIIHVESQFDITSIRNRARELDILLGFAVNPDTDLALLKPYFETNAYFQVMGVNPGSSNQPQISQTPLAVSYLRKSTLQHVIISVDGGVGVGNIGKLKMAGADYFASTHGIFATSSWQENYDNLVNLVDQGDN